LRKHSLGRLLNGRRPPVGALKVPCRSRAPLSATPGCTTIDLNPGRPYRSLARALCLALLLSLVPVLHPLEQSIDAGSVDSVMRKAIEAWKVPGASVAIVRGANGIYLKGYGLKTAGGADAVTPDTVCHRTGLARHDLLWYGSPWNGEEILRRIGFVKLSRPLSSTPNRESEKRSRRKYANRGPVHPGIWPHLRGTMKSRRTASPAYPWKGTA